MRFGVYREIEVEVCPGQGHGGVGQARDAGVSGAMDIDIWQAKQAGACLGSVSEPCLVNAIVVHVSRWPLSCTLARYLLVQMRDEAAVELAGGMEVGMEQQRLQLVVDDKTFPPVSHLCNDLCGFSGQDQGRFLFHSPLHLHDHQNRYMTASCGGGQHALPAVLVSGVPTLLPRNWKVWAELRRLLKAWAQIETLGEKAALAGPN